MTENWPGEWHSKSVIDDGNCSDIEITEFMGRLTMVGRSRTEWLQYESERDEKLTQLGL